MTCTRCGERRAQDEASGLCPRCTREVADVRRRTTAPPTPTVEGAREERIVVVDGIEYIVVWP